MAGFLACRLLVLDPYFAEAVVVCLAAGDHLVLLPVEDVLVLDLAVVAVLVELASDPAVQGADLVGTAVADDSGLADLDPVPDLDLAGVDLVVVVEAHLQLVAHGFVVADLFLYHDVCGWFSPDFSD